MLPIVSVIVPVYNAEKYLRPCLDSIIRQTLNNIEIILVDDGSTDSSLQILQEYAKDDKRIKVVKQRNSGPGKARNKGICMAKGKYLSFMDADDFFEPDLLESLYRKAETTNSDIVFCRFWMFNEETQKNEPPEYDVSMNLLPEDDIFSSETYPEYILNLYITAVWSSMYRREFIIANDIKFSMATRVEDNLFAQTAIAMANRMSFLNRKLIHYRRFFNTSLTDKVNIYWLNSFIVHKEIKDYLISHNKYEKLKNSFLHHMINHFRYHVIERCSEPIKSIASFYTQKYLQDEFSLGLYDISKYTNQWTYDFYEKLYRKQNKTDILEKFMVKNPNNIIPIVYSVNEKFAPIAAVSIQSVIENANSQYFYDIYLLHKNLSPEIQAKFERLTKGNIRLSCINVEDHLSKIPKLYEQNQYSEEMFYRFMIPDLFYGYDKIVYLDADTIVVDDISKMIKADMYGKAIAGCVQPLIKKFQKYCVKKLKVELERYINSGVLIFDTKKCYELKISRRCFDLIGEKGTWIAPDQDILNVACKDTIAYLDSSWNCIANIEKRSLKDYDSNSYSLEIEKLHCAKILHFTSLIKPWKINNFYESLVWWNYARKSIFYEALLLRIY